MSDWRGPTSITTLCLRCDRVRGTHQTNTGFCLRDDEERGYSDRDCFLWSALKCAVCHEQVGSAEDYLCAPCRKHWETRVLTNEGFRDIIVA